MLKALKPSLFFLIISFLMTACGGNDKDMNTTENAEKITATKFLKRFENDPQGAQLKYLGKAFEVSGKIAEVSNSSLGAVVFSLQTESKTGAMVMCTMLSDNLKYEPGNEVSIKGFCSEYKFNLTLDKCVTVD